MAHRHSARLLPALLALLLVACACRPPTDPPEAPPPESRLSLPAEPRSTPEAPADADEELTDEPTAEEEPLEEVLWEEDDEADADEGYVAEYTELAVSDRLERLYDGPGHSLEPVMIPDFDSSLYIRPASTALAGGGDLFVVANEHGLLYAGSCEFSNALYYYDGKDRVHTLLPDVEEIAGTRDNLLYLIRHENALPEQSDAGEASAAAHSLITYDPASGETALLREGVVGAHVREGSDIVYLLTRGEWTQHRYSDYDYRIHSVTRWNTATGEETVIFADDGAYPQGLWYSEEEDAFHGLLFAGSGIFSDKDDGFCFTLDYPYGSEIRYTRTLTIDRESGEILSDSEAKWMELHRREMARIRSGDRDEANSVYLEPYGQEKPDDPFGSELETQVVELAGYSLVVDKHYERGARSNGFIEWEIWADSGGEKTQLIGREMSWALPQPIGAGDIALIHAGDLYVYDGRTLYRLLEDFSFYQSGVAGGYIYLYGEDAGTSLAKLYRNESGEVVCEWVFRVGPPGAGGYSRKGPCFYGDFIVLDAPNVGEKTGLVFYNTSTGDAAGIDLNDQPLALA